MTKRNLPIEQRLLMYVERSGGCWLWVASGNEYGQLRVNGKNAYAHRLAFETWKGAIPSGFEVDHLCKVPRCINPDHLEAVPPRVNTLRSTNPAALNARKTQCPRGHEYSVQKSGKRTGKRWCRPCTIASVNRSKARRGV